MHLFTTGYAVGEELWREGYKAEGKVHLFKFSVHIVFRMLYCSFNNAPILKMYSVNIGVNLMSHSDHQTRFNLNEMLVKLELIQNYKDLGWAKK